MSAIDRVEQVTTKNSVFVPLQFSFSSALFPARNGVGFSCPIRPPIVLDPNYSYCAVPVSAQIPNLTPNISSALGNNQWIYSKDGVNFVAVVLNDGLYGVTDLQTVINNLIYQRGDITNPDTDPAFTFAPIQATQQIQVNIVKAGWYFRIQAGGLGTILGFNDGTYGVGPEVVTGQFAANFSQLFAYVVHCDIVNGGYYFSNSAGATAGDVLYVVDITAPPASLISQISPFPAKVSLSRKVIDQMNFYLTDQNGKLIESLGDQPWSLQFYIDRVLPYKD
jgi:hypothetical protein